MRREEDGLDWFEETIKELTAFTVVELHALQLSWLKLEIFWDVETPQYLFSTVWVHHGYAVYLQTYSPSAVQTRFGLLIRFPLNGISGWF